MYTRTKRSTTLALLAISLVILTAQGLTSVQSKVPPTRREGIVTANNGTTWSVRLPYQEGLGKTAEVEQQEETEDLSPDAASRILPSLETVDFAMVMVLMGISGMVEAISLRYYNCFPNMMTGNTVKFLDALLDCRWHDSCWSASMVGLYLVGCTIYKAIEKKHQQQVSLPQRIPRTIHRVAQATLLSFGLSDMISWIFHANDLAHRWRLPIMALGFGMLNSLCSQVWQTVTYALTGHYHKIGSNLVEAFTGKKKGWPSLDKSSGGLLIFSLTMFVTSFLLRVGEKHSWFLRKRLLPPFGLTLGFLYATLLTGYSQYYQWVSQHGLLDQPKTSS